eukprot:CAMPEP_0118953236 /NCGR_PEP_ID=MMETSP1169-20130426/56218_1 /TAXON_ID=36882 /ORGANISM="Pyramimonas obovata, Strain CCMP722" /LENGTH=768 /DNA_ID=CAMNT_0006900649 /DNA_START=195 /DNA_END=2497 /DNA_ORIENTATION=+
MQIPRVCKDALQRYYSYHEARAPRISVTHVEPKTGYPHNGTLIWLCGIGELPNEPVLGPLLTGDPAAKLKAYLHPAMPDFRLVIPRPPMRAVQMTGNRCPAWWDVESANTYPDYEDVDGITESAEFVRSLVRAEIEKGTPPSRIILAGFSQGAALALHCACTVLEDKLLAVLCFAGWLPLCRRVFHDEGIAIRPPKFTSSNHDTPIFLHCVEEDLYVPWKAGEMVSKILQTAGFHQTHLRLMDGSGHSCSRPHMQQGWDWLEPLIVRELERGQNDGDDLEAGMSRSGGGVVGSATLPSHNVPETSIKTATLAMPDEQQSALYVFQNGICAPLSEGAKGAQDWLDVGASAAQWSASDRSRYLRILFDSVHIGDTQSMLQVLKAGVCIDTCDQRGDTLLHHAARNNDMRMVAELWKLGADANAYNRAGDSPATISAKCMTERNAGSFAATFGIEPKEDLYVAYQLAGMRVLAGLLMLRARLPWLRLRAWTKVSVYGVPSCMTGLMFYMVYLPLHWLGLHLYNRCPEEDQPLDVRVVYGGMAAVLSLQMGCMLSDPGYIRRSPEQPVEQPVDQNSSEREDRSPSTGHCTALLTGLKYCVQCRVWQIKEAHHCHTCQACVLRRDHHCLWVANCVGYRNAALFLSFYTAFLVTASASLAALTFLLVAQADRFREEYSVIGLLGWLVVAIGGVSIYMFGDAYFTTIDLWSHGVTSHEDASRKRKARLAFNLSRLRSGGGKLRQDTEQPVREDPLAVRLLHLWRMLTRNAVTVQA